MANGGGEIIHRAPIRRASAPFDESVEKRGANSCAGIKPGGNHGDIRNLVPEYGRGPKEIRRSPGIAIGGGRWKRAGFNQSGRQKIQKEGLLRDFDRRSAIKQLALKMKDCWRKRAPQYEPHLGVCGLLRLMFVRNKGDGYGGS